MYTSNSQGDLSNTFYDTKTRNYKSVTCNRCLCNIYAYDCGSATQHTQQQSRQLWLVAQVKKKSRVCVEEEARFIMRHTHMTDIGETPETASDVCTYMRTDTAPSKTTLTCPHRLFASISSTHLTTTHKKLNRTPHKNNTSKLKHTQKTHSSTRNKRYKHQKQKIGKQTKDNGTHHLVEQWG